MMSRIDYPVENERNCPSIAKNVVQREDQYFLPQEIMGTFLLMRGMMVVNGISKGVWYDRKIKRN
jgi:hypothetical protein